MPALHALGGMILWLVVIPTLALAALVGWLR
jgi:hypothetical protein